MTDNEKTDAFLAHFGVKGMRWGKRKARDSDSGGESSGGSSKPKKLTRKEVKQEKADFYQKKADNLLKVASTDPDSLIAVRTPNTYIATVATGKEFLDYMAKGGYMDIKMSDVYATKDANSGNYVLNDKMNQRYVRSDKKK